MQTYATVVLGSGGAAWLGLGAGAGLGLGMLAAILAGLIALPMVAGDWGTTVSKEGTRDVALFKRIVEKWMHLT